ncbi:hypothetical protein TrLO_g13983 [Triparma laevis f. longispina]|uniref:Uncharacterized protein n=1 Tax=Triparma laevis f. longispina TaxID=1714387 RepID=A0A9W7C6Z8_9STRA|nr:hypothetical protein TrLO_g13983 [Triparma laevis f. longispina]
MVTTRSQTPKKVPAAASAQGTSPPPPGVLLPYTLPLTLSGVNLYSISPFYTSPLKLLSNFLCGAPYPLAYKHFRRDHQGTLNLVYHCTILVLQLLCNFGFLYEVDERLPFDLPFNVSISSLSCYGWMTCLLFTQSPAWTKALSSCLIYFAFTVGPQVAAAAFPISIHLQPFLDTLVYIYFIKKPTTVNIYLIIFIIRVTLTELTLTHAGGSVQLSSNFYYGFLLVIAMLSHKPFTRPASGVFGIGALFGWLLAAVSGDRLFFLWGAGFIATALQGVSHRETHEPPTMPQLANISNELAHSTFFPCLLLQAVGDQAMMIKED